MSVWRPEGWQNPFKEIDIVPIEGVVATGILEHNAFEAGADAMLEKVCEEIEEVKNPLQPATVSPFTHQSAGFEKFHQKILFLFRSKK